MIEHIHYFADNRKLRVSEIDEIASVQGNIRKGYRYWIKLKGSREKIYSKLYKKRRVAKENHNLLVCKWTGIYSVYDDID